jgi:hypothetical protein
MKWIWFFLALISGSVCHAFPELIRFGYNTCITCHVSPAGAGTLTSYGRSLSSEVLSTWGTEKEAGFLNGQVDREKVESWVLMGGDVRAVQVHKEDEFVKAGRFIKMQADIGAAIVRGAWTASANLGAFEANTWVAKINNPYIMYRPLDQLSVRIGRFIPQYGIYIRDHIFFIRSFLGLAPGLERDTAEVQWTGEDWTSQISYSIDNVGLGKEKSITAQVQRFFLGSHKIALNYWHGDAEAFKRDIYGAWSLFGFNKKNFLLTEFDLQQKNTTLLTTKSFVGFSKYGHTFFKGFDGLIIAEMLQNDVHNSKTKIDRFGLGFQFFPRPHFEVSGSWLKQTNYAISNYRGDYAWLQLHYYF